MGHSNSCNAQQTNQLMNRLLIATMLIPVLCAPFATVQTWCPPCRHEIPSMESISQDLGEKGFVVLAVNQFETPDHVFAYMGQLSVFPTFPLLFDHDSRVSGLYGVKGLPTTLLINRQGQVVYRAIGGRDFDHPRVRAIVNELLTDNASETSAVSNEK